MKNFKIMLSLVIAFVVGLFALTACSSSSGVKASDVNITPTATTQTVTLKLTFAANDNISAKTAVPSIYEYKYDETSEEYTYITKQEVEFSNSVYTSATVKFTSLTASTTYRYVLYITYNSYEEEITSLEVTTKSNSSVSDATSIKTTDEFLAIAEDPEGYFSLDADLDFSNASITALFTASTPFKGTFLGNGHTISNFTLSAANYMGLFNVMNGAKLTDLNIENVVVDMSTGRSSSSIGAISGLAVNSVIENVEVTNVDFDFAGISSTTLYMGGAFGNVQTSTITDVNVNNVDINISRVRLKMYLGLFAGAISGSVYNGATYAVSDCYATGSITSTLYFNSTSTTSTGELMLGGFIGNLTSNGLISDCYSDSDITIYKSDSSRGYATLHIGGFIGSGTNFNVNECVAITKLDINAGEIAEDDETSTTTTDTTITTTDASSTNVNDFTSVSLLANSELSTVTGDYYTYVGGFVGYAAEPYARLANSYVYLKSTTNYNALVTSYVSVDDFAGYNPYTEGTRYTDCKVTTDMSDYSAKYGADSSVYEYLVANYNA